MKSALVLTGVLAGISFSTASASAGGYLGLGLGAQPAVNDDLMPTVVPEGRSLRVLAGARYGNVALEGALNGFGVVVDNHGDQTMYQLSAALKLSLPLGSGFEAFGRAGLERTWLHISDAPNNWMGDGFLAGGGFEYRLNLAVTSASLFVDYTVHHATLEDGGHSTINETSRIWALGFTVGL
jgi:opacity protein-like surface antigen